MENDSQRIIRFYKKNGLLQSEDALTPENIGRTNGMMIRCRMQNGSVCEGYSDPFRTHCQSEWDGSVHDFIYLWTWKYLNEETHQLIGDGNSKFEQDYVSVRVDDILHIDAILHSNPRWGGMLTNKFFVEIKED